MTDSGKTPVAPGVTKPEERKEITASSTREPKKAAPVVIETRIPKPGFTNDKKRNLGTSSLPNKTEKTDMGDDDAFEPSDTETLMKEFATKVKLYDMKLDDQSKLFTELIKKVEDRGQAEEIHTLTLRTMGNAYVQPKFSGNDAEDWSSFLEEFTDYGTACLLTEEQLLKILPASLSGAAKQAYLKMAATDKTDMKKLNAKMMETFTGTPQQTMRARNEVMLLKHKEKESLTEFATRTKRLIDKANPEMAKVKDTNREVASALDRFAMDAFLWGIDRSIEGRGKHRERRASGLLARSGIETTRQCQVSQNFGKGLVK